MWRQIRRNLPLFFATGLSACSGSGIDEGQIGFIDGFFGGIIVDEPRAAETGVAFDEERGVPTIGLVDDARWQRFESDDARRRALLVLLDRLRWEGRSLCERLRNPNVDEAGLVARFDEVRGWHRGLEAELTSRRIRGPPVLETVPRDHGADLARS